MKKEWTEADDTRLIELALQGSKSKGMGAVMGFPIQTIREHLGALGCFWDTRQRPYKWAVPAELIPDERPKPLPMREALRAGFCKAGIQDNEYNILGIKTP